jgi:phosphate uptake regulator
MGMDQRKIMSLGRSSLVISLPKRWIKLNELERGDTVSLDIQRDRSLVVFPEVKKKKELQKITLKVDPAKKEESLIREIIACYLNGYFGITLVSTDIFTVEQQKAVRAIAGILYMGILESDARRIYIQTLVDESKAPVETAIRRMHIISGSMCRDALESLRNQDAELAKVVHALDDDVDQLGFFLIRLLRGTVLDPDLAKQLNLEPIDCLDYQTLVHRIEHVADHAAAISRNVISVGRGQWFSSSMLEYILNLGNETLELYNEAVRAFFSGDAASSNDLIGRQNELDEKLAACTVGEMNPLLACMMCSIRDSLRRVAEYAADIAEVTINHSYKPTPT